MTKHLSFTVSGVYDKKYFEKDFPEHTNSYLHETSKSQTLGEYIVIFESIFLVEDMFQAYYQHLDYERCSENLDFLVDLDKFLKECKKEVSIKTLKNLIDLYFISGGNKELNLSHQTKEGLLKALKDQLTQDTWKLKETPEEVFFNTRNAILLEMKMGTFPRFVRKNLCQLVIIKQNYHKDIVFLKKNIEFPYKDEDFSFPIVTDKDINFLKSMTQDTFDWVIVSSSPTLTSYWCNKGYMRGVKFYSLPCVVRFEVVLPFSMQRVAASIISSKECEQFEEITKRVTILKEYDHDTCKQMMKDKGYDFSEKNGKRRGYTARWDLSLPFPFTTPRQLHGAYTIDYDPTTGTLVRASRSILTEGCEDKRNLKVFVNKTGDEVTKPTFSTVDMRLDSIQRIDDNRTLYKQIHVYSPMGWAKSLFLQKIVSGKVGSKFEKSFNAHLAKKKEDTWEDVYNSLKGDPAGSILEEIDIPKADKEFRDQEYKRMSIFPDEKIELKERKSEKFEKEEKIEIKEEQVKKDEIK